MSRQTLLATAILGGWALSVQAADDMTELDAVTVSASTSRVPWSEAALPNTITIIDRAQL